LPHIRSPTGLYDEPKILRYAITSVWPIGVDVRHPEFLAFDRRHQNLFRALIAAAA